MRAEACQFGATAIVRELLHAGAHLVTDNTGMTGRDYAVKHAHDAIVEIIDSAGALSSTSAEQMFAGGAHREGAGVRSSVVNMPRAAVSATRPTGSARKMEEAPNELSQKMSAAPDAHGVVVNKLNGDHDSENVKLLDAHSVEMAAVRNEMLQQASEDQPSKHELTREMSAVPDAHRAVVVDSGPSSFVSAEPSYETAVKKAAAVADAAEAAHNAISQARAWAAVADSASPLLGLPDASLEQVSPSALSRFDQAEDPSDPMATIRRLAGQYRSKHFHQRLAARHDAVRAI